MNKEALSRRRFLGLTAAWGALTLSSCGGSVWFNSSPKSPEDLLRKAHQTIGGTLINDDDIIEITSRTIDLFSARVADLGDRRNLKVRVWPKNPPDTFANFSSPDAVETAYYSFENRPDEVIVYTPLVNYPKYFFNNDLYGQAFPIYEFSNFEDENSCQLPTPFTTLVTSVMKSLSKVYPRRITKPDDWKFPDELVKALNGLVGDTAHPLLNGYLNNNVVMPVGVRSAGFQDESAIAIEGPHPCSTCFNNTIRVELMGLSDYIARYISAKNLVDSGLSYSGDPVWRPSQILNILPFLGRVNKTGSSLLDIISTGNNFLKFVQATGRYYKTPAVDLDEVPYGLRLVLDTFEQVRNNLPFYSPTC